MGPPRTYTKKQREENKKRAREWREKMKDDPEHKEHERERRKDYYWETERATKKSIKTYNKKCAKRQQDYRDRLKSWRDASVAKKKKGN